MELQLHHRAPVKIIYHAEITGDEIHITQEKKDKTGFTEFIVLTGIYRYKQTDQKPPVINRTLALYRVENLPGNAKKAGFDPRKVVETTMDTYEDGAYDKTQSWSIKVFTEDRKYYCYRVALNGREISKLTGFGLWLIVKDGVLTCRIVRHRVQGGYLHEKEPAIFTDCFLLCNYFVLHGTTCDGRAGCQ